jgi:tripartite-type tricarboxylate transporter receptor subunit TctC
VLGGTAVGAAGSDVPIVLRDTIGINVKLVEGYQDSGAIFLAVDRGEINGRTVDLSSMKSFRPAWMAPNGGMRALVQFARATRHPELPDVPTARELARNDEARALIAFAELSYLISRPFAAPPDVPAERAKALQDAFMAVHRDVAYLDEAARLRMEVSPIDSRAVLDTIDRIAAAPPSVLDYLRRIMTAAKGG